MALLWKNLLKRIKRNDDSIHLKEALEKNLVQLKENVFYSQQLAQIGSWTFDIQKSEAFWTEEIYNILGCGSQCLNDKIESFFPYVHTEDLERVKKATQDALEGKECDMRYRIITSDGTVKYVHEKTKTLYDENSNPVKIVGIIQNITKHILIEYNLNKLGENLSRSQKVSGIGCWKYDVIKDEFLGSEEMYRIFGIDPTYFKNKLNNVIKLIHPDDQIKVQNAMEKHFAGESCEFEFRIPQYDGKMKFVIGKGEPLFDKGGRVLGILGTVQDITDKKLLEDELKRSNKNLAKTQSLAHIGGWEMDFVHGKYYMSEETYNIYGITPEQHNGTYKGFLKFVHPDDVDIINSILENPSKEQFRDMEFRVIRSDGSERNVYQQMEFIFDKDDKLTFIYGTIQDITEKKELERKLKHIQESIHDMQRGFQVLIQESSDVFEIVTPDGIIQYISSAVEKILGFKPEERVGKSTFEFAEGEEKFKMKKMFESVLNSTHNIVKDDVAIRTRSGGKIYISITMSNQLSEPSIHGIVINWRDITSRIELEKRIAHIATHDELTGLLNDLSFKKLIKNWCKNTDKKNDLFALMMMDVDRFKYINDALDYGLGDELIIQIGRRLKNCLSDKYFICRYSEDQFAIIAPGIGIEEYNSVVKDIMNLFLYPFKLGMYEIYVTVSMGISIYPEDGDDYDSLIKHANIALIRAKEEGKNRYKFYSSNMDINSYKQLMLQNDLRMAIEKEQVRVYYQPQINLQTNEILGAEALIRWEHPTWGLVKPDEFISLAEESGFIIDLGNWMLTEVCRAYKKWLDDGLPAIKVSINYSSIQFFQKDFVGNIKNTIGKFGLNPHFLIIEITESVLIKNTERVISYIKDLQSMGIQVAIDDFGTGVSSLGYLNMFNIDILKIDRSFIKDITLNEKSSIITRTVINMAQEMRIKLVAEGIENWDQLSYLRKLNCHTGQGYLYSKPVSEQDFGKILARKKCKPVRANDAKVKPYEERRRFYRVDFTQLLEADMTILEIGGKRTSVGNTKVVIKDMGLGGLRFISNIKLPIKRDIVLQFTTELLGKEIKVYGCPVWMEEVLEQLYEYGIEFTFDENDRMVLAGVLNQVQVKIRNNTGFAHGRFVSNSLVSYFKAGS